jgi:hypothetical protein
LTGKAPWIALAQILGQQNWIQLAEIEEERLPLS